MRLRAQEVSFLTAEYLGRCATDVQPFAMHPVELACQPFRQRNVVGILPGNQVGPCRGNTCIPSIRAPAMRYKQGANARIALGKVTEYLR